MVVVCHDLVHPQCGSQQNINLSLFAPGSRALSAQTSTNISACTYWPFNSDGNLLGGLHTRSMPSSKKVVESYGAWSLPRRKDLR